MLAHMNWQAVVRFIVAIDCLYMLLLISLIHWRHYIRYICQVVLKLIMDTSWFLGGSNTVHGWYIRWVVLNLIRNIS